MPDALSDDANLSDVDWSKPGTTVGLWAKHLGWQMIIGIVAACAIGLAVIGATARHLFTPDWPWALGACCVGLGFLWLAYLSARSSRRLVTTPALVFDHEGITSNLHPFGGPVRVRWADVGQVLLTRIRHSRSAPPQPAVLLVPRDPAGHLRRYFFLKRWAVRMMWWQHGHASALIIGHFVTSDLESVAQLAADLAGVEVTRDDG
ncbi:MAG TPA: hypothetical protein VD997_17040 [Phycisphaerales bacterium]|nr:hypothetical protein [Phycisphaerales bacterium]